MELWRRLELELNRPELSSRASSILLLFKKLAIKKAYLKENNLSLEELRTRFANKSGKKQKRSSI